jgi:hypothetical protein
MSDHHDDQPEIRRVSQDDRKTRLESGPLFPDDDGPLPDDDTIRDEALLDDTLLPDTSAIEENTLRQKLPDTAERFPRLTYDSPVQPEPSRQAKVAKPRRNPGDWRHNVVALLFLIATVALAGVYTWLWQNPYNPDNPLALATDFYFVTETPAPTTAAVAEATEDALAFIPSVGGLPFAIAEPGVTYTANSTDDCDWASIGGTVTGLQGEPLDGYRVSITDADDPGRLDVGVFSGAVLSFGPGGFEYILGNAPRAGRYDVQLLSAAGVPLSDEIRITTRATCEENVAIINFVQTEAI